MIAAASIELSSDIVLGVLTLAATQFGVVVKMLWKQGNRLTAIETALHLRAHVPPPDDHGTAVPISFNPSAERART